MTHESQIQTHYLLVNPLQLTIHLFKRLCFDLVGDSILVPVAHGVLPELGLAAGVGTDEVLLGPGVVSIVLGLPLGQVTLTIAGHTPVTSASLVLNVPQRILKYILNICDLKVLTWLT